MNAQQKQLQRKTMKIDADIHKELQEQSKKNNMTMTDFLVVLLDMTKKDKTFDADSSTNIMVIKYESIADLARQVAKYLYDNNIDIKEFLEILRTKHKRLILDQR